MNVNWNGYIYYKHIFLWNLIDNMYHKGDISKMSVPDVYSLLEIQKRTSRYHGNAYGSLNRKLDRLRNLIHHFKI